MAAGKVTTLPPLRSHREIQKAHDMLGALLLGDSEVLKRIVDEDKIEQVETAMHVLCWVLHHDHNTTFETNLRDVECFLREEGIEMVDVGPHQIRPKGSEGGHA